MARITTVLGILTAILFAFPSDVKSSKILLVPLQQKSHMIFMHAAGQALLKRGHKVYTIVGSNFPEPKDLEKLGFKILRFDVPKDILTMLSPEIHEQMGDTFFHGKPMGSFTLPYDSCVQMLSDTNLLQDIRNIQFDIALVDGMPVAPCGFLIPHVLGIRYMYMSSGLLPELMRIPALPSFVPALMIPFSDKMSFLQRVKNLFLTVAFESGIPVNDFMQQMRNYTLLEKYSQDPTIRTWYDLERRSELFFITRGPSLEYPSPYMPNVIPLEGITASPAKDLPPGELQNFVQTSTENIVVVSFGSMFGSFPDEINEKLINAFRLRKENFIWKVSAKDMKHLKGHVPSNVKLISWLPQNDLLGHPKTRLFITHSGNNGQYEALYHGVPMIGFPFQGEQEHNAMRLVSHGFGLSADLRTITSEELVRKIEEVITNPIYYDNIKKASKILHSFPQSAGDKCAYWIEHVIQFGSQHLRSYALDMPFHQYMMLDIAVFICTLIAIVLFCMKYMFMLAYRGLKYGNRKKDKMN